ncbi:MAG: aldo/keto reductase [Acidobacteria bacterium]|nr:MAG: aldo/keto reductase [Acidobacteriota bacterium]
MLIDGHATPEGTARYCQRHADRLPGHYRQSRGLWLSSIGLGTYLGDPTDAVDKQYTQAVLQVARAGVNVFDTAVNYRHMHSERAIGRAVSELISSGAIQRDEFLLATKGGFLGYDSKEPDDPSAYFQARLVRTGLVKPEEIVAGCHTLSPRYLDHQIDVSRGNLGVGAIDLYYLHNPETQLREVSHEEFLRRLRLAIVVLEQAVADGKIRMYGTATWNGFRVQPGSQEAISLEEILGVAREVGGQNHHFGAIQLPFNIAMPEALAANTQASNGRLVPPLQIAREHGLIVFSSATLLQGHLSKGLPAGIVQSIPGFATDAQRAIQFVRSTPGITCALVGMSRHEHLEENLAAALRPPLSLADYRKMFQK